MIIWDLEKKCVLHKLALHKGTISSLSFSFDEKFLVSLGGEEDNNIAVWDIANGKVVCGAPASKYFAPVFFLPGCQY